jgi:hypothetical protein
MLGGDVVLANAAAMELLEAADQAVLRGIALDSPPGRRMERSLRLASGQPVGVTFERIPGAGGVLFEFRAGSSHSPRANPPPHSTRRPGTTPGDRWCVHSIVCVRAVHCQTGEKRAPPRQWRSTTPSTVRWKAARASSAGRRHEHGPCRGRYRSALRCPADGDHGTRLRALGVVHVECSGHRRPRDPITSACRTQPRRFGRSTRSRWSALRKTNSSAWWPRGAAAARERDGKGRDRADVPDRE